MDKKTYYALVEVTHFVATREDKWEEEKTVLTSLMLMDEDGAEEIDNWVMEGEPEAPFTDCILRKTNYELSGLLEWDGEEQPKASEVNWEMLEIEEVFEQWTTFEVVGDYVLSSKDEITIEEAEEFGCPL